MIDAISTNGGIPIEGLPAKLNNAKPITPAGSSTAAPNAVRMSPTGQPSQTTARDFEAMRKAVQAAVDKLVDAAEDARTTVTFAVHDETRVVMIRVSNANTGELIREFPPEQVLESAAQILQSMGLFVDQSA